MAQSAPPSRLIFWSLLIISIIGLTAYLSTQLEWVERNINLGWSAKARTYPFLAAQRYLEKSNSVTDSFRLESVDSLDNTDVLFIPNSRMLRTPTRLDEVEQWVHNGGHLILGAAYLSLDLSLDENDELLDRFELELYSTAAQCHRCPLSDDRDGDKHTESTKPNSHAEEFEKLFEHLAQQQKDKTTQRNNIENQRDPQKLTVIQFESDSETYKADFLTTRALWRGDMGDYEDTTQYPTTFWGGGDEGAHLVQISAGQGLVTAVSNIEVWRNESISHFDHALILKRIVGENKNVHLLFGAEVPSLWQRLSQHFPEALISIFTFIVLWLWMQLIQFGPRKSSDSLHRRALSEHIQAAAQYLWRCDQQKLLANARKSFFQKAFRCIPGFKALSNEQQIRILSRQSALNEDDVKTLLFDTLDEEMTNRNFTKTIQTIQQLRKAL